MLTLRFGFLVFIQYKMGIYYNKSFNIGNIFNSRDKYEC